LGQLSSRLHQGRIFGQRLHQIAERSQASQCPVNQGTQQRIPVDWAASWLAWPLFEGWQIAEQPFLGQANGQVLAVKERLLFHTHS
jgi:hypothetical protein